MRRQDRDERGAAAVIVAVAMSAVLLVIAAIAVDLGSQRVVRSDMQALADVVALDMSRQLTGKKVNEYTATEQSSMQTAFVSSVKRNVTTLGGAVDPATDDISWDFVVWNVATKKWDPLTKWSSPTEPEGIRVTASSDVAFVFAGMTGADSGGATRQAVGALDPLVCFSAGSNLADIDTADNVLVQALETFLGIDLLDLSASAVGPDGILSLKNTKIPLLDLAAALDVGTVDALVSSNQPITVGQLLEASAEVLNNQGTAAALDAALIFQALAAQANLATPTLLVSDILSIAPGAGSALTAEIGVLDLLNALVYVAGEHAVGASVPLNVPLVGLVDADVSVIEIPKITCAKPGQNPPGRAESAQVRLDAEVDLPVTGSLLTNVLAGVNNLLSSLLGGLLGTREERVKPGTLWTKVRISATAAHSSAVLKSPGGIRCSSTGASGQGVSFDVTSGLANLSVSIDTGYELERRTRPSFLSPWGPWQTFETIDETLIGITAGLGDETPYTADLDFPLPPSEEMPSHTRNTPLAINLSLTTSQQNAVTGLLGDLATPIINNLLNPLLTAFNTSLMPQLDAALGLLGVTLGKTTVKASGRPSCYPKLVG